MTEPKVGQAIYLPEFTEIDPVIGKRHGGKATITNIWKSAPNEHWVATREHSPHNIIPWEKLLLPVQVELREKYKETIAFAKF
jgi:hypothetical protein